MGTIKDETIKKYLLGAMPETERAQFEEQYFEQDDLYRRMQVVEEELISEYIHHRLTAAERQLFDRHYSATPERRRRIETARRWKRIIVDPYPEQLSERLKQRFWSLAGLFNFRTVLVAAGVGLVLAAGVSAWSYLEARRSPGLVAGGERSPDDRPSPNLNGNQERYVAVELTIAGNLLRPLNDQTDSVTIPGGFSGANLSLPIPPQFGSRTFKSCLARLYWDHPRGEPAGDPIWPAGDPVWEGQIDGDAVRGQRLELKIPKTAFGGDGLYTVLLTLHTAGENGREQSFSTGYRMKVTIP
ncbi:MAG TPA: hypothetical protein VJ302_18670 [Blastocatellia bacterium]|nr:hypothetical protein [Blastocatellia bacterium]